MVAVVIGLGAAILYERSQVTDGCFQTSISAYYYTPVHAFFIGALMSVGVCLFCLKGNSDLEDVLLNLAGLLAPFVALVPTPKPGTCGSVLETVGHRSENVANNVRALLLIEILGLLALSP